MIRKKKITIKENCNSSLYWVTDLPWQCCRVPEAYDRCESPDPAPQSPGLESQSVVASPFTTVHLQMAQHTAEISHVQRDFPSLATPRETVPGIGARSISVISITCCQLLIPYSQLLQVSPPSTGTGLHHAKSEKHVYLCYLASSRGHTLLIQIKKWGEK